jgi:hypothetical protein
MKNKYNAPNVTVIIGFIFINVLLGVFYRYNELFIPQTYLYLWLLLMVAATIILLWGIKIHFASFQSSA